MFISMAFTHLRVCIYQCIPPALMPTFTCIPSQCTAAAAWLVMVSSLQRARRVLVPLSGVSEDRSPRKQPQVQGGRVICVNRLSRSRLIPAVLQHFLTFALFPQDASASNGA